MAVGRSELNGAIESTRDPHFEVSTRCNFLFQLLPLQARPFESLLALWVGTRFFSPSELQFPAAAFGHRHFPIPTSHRRRSGYSNGDDDAGLFALKQHRHKRRRAEPAQPQSSTRPRSKDMTSGPPARRFPIWSWFSDDPGTALLKDPPPAAHDYAAGVSKNIASIYTCTDRKLLRQLSREPRNRVVAAAFTVERRCECVVEIVAPVASMPVTVASRGVPQRLVQIASAISASSAPRAPPAPPFQRQAAPESERPDRSRNA